MITNHAIIQAQKRIGLILSAEDNEAIQELISQNKTHMLRRISRRSSRHLILYKERVFEAVVYNHPTRIVIVLEEWDREYALSHFERLNRAT